MQFLFIYIVGLSFSVSVCGPLIPHVFETYIVSPAPGFTSHEYCELISAVVCCAALFNAFLRLPYTRLSAILFGCAAHVAAMGTGMHVAANSLHSVMNPGNEWSEIKFSKIGILAYFLDETLSHHLLLGGLAIMFLMLVPLKTLCLSN